MWCYSKLWQDEITHITRRKRLPVSNLRSGDLLPGEAKLNTSTRSQDKSSPHPAGFLQIWWRPQGRTIALHIIELKDHRFLLTPKHPCPSPEPATSSVFSSSYAASPNSLCPELLSIRHQLADLPNSDHLPFRRARWLMRIQTLIELGRPPMDSLNAPASTATVTWGLDGYTENSGLCPEGHVEHRRFPPLNPKTSSQLPGRIPELWGSF